MKYFFLAFLLCFPPSVSPFASRLIKIHIAFGYKDARPLPFVSDLFEKAYLLKLLTAPCRAATDRDCGFTRDPDDGDLLTRELRAAAGHARDFIQLRVASSSVGPDDDENRRDPFQAAQSRISEKNFLSGIAGADATFYVGHSRDGGGPDFEPPRLTKGQHTNYAWYRRSKPGLNKLLAELRQSANAPKKRWLSLISCGSGRWFRAPIHAVARNVHVRTVDGLIYYADGITQLRRILALYLVEAVPAGDPTPTPTAKAVAVR